jgi:hypothetical protein
MQRTTYNSRRSAFPIRRGRPGKTRPRWILRRAARRACEASRAHSSKTRDAFTFARPGGQGAKPPHAEARLMAVPHGMHRATVRIGRVQSVRCDACVHARRRMHTCKCAHDLCSPAHGTASPRAEALNARRRIGTGTGPTPPTSVRDWAAAWGRRRTLRNAHWPPMLQSDAPALN